MPNNTYIHEAATTDNIHTDALSALENYSPSRESHHSHMQSAPMPYNYIIAPYTKHWRG